PGHGLGAPRGDGDRLSRLAPRPHHPRASDPGRGGRFRGLDRRFAARGDARAARSPRQRGGQLLQHAHRRPGGTSGAAPGGGVSGFASRARLWFSFTRPFTLLPPTFGVLSGALTAFGSAHDPDPQHRFTFAVAASIALGSLCAALLNAASN